MKEIQQYIENRITEINKASCEYDRRSETYWMNDVKVRELEKILEVVKKNNKK